MSEAPSANFLRQCTAASTLKAAQLLTALKPVPVRAGVPDSSEIWMPSAGGTNMIPARSRIKALLAFATIFSSFVGRVAVKAGQVPCLSVQIAQIRSGSSSWPLLEGKRFGWSPGHPLEGGRAVPAENHHLLE